MTKWNVYTPEGMQDLLFDQCYTKRNLEEKLRGLFRLHGYLEIETPALEFCDVFSTTGALDSNDAMFKFFDNRGRILVLRADMTIPVARVAATKLKGYQYPIKVCCIGSKYMNLGKNGNGQKDTPTAGVEVFGANTPEADADIIFTAIEAIKETGMENFQIEIGQIDFFKGLIGEAEISQQEAEQLRIMIDRKDQMEVKRLIEEYGIKGDVKDIILKLPNLFGSADVIEDFARLKLNNRSRSALENLKNILGILEKYGVANYISVDLGMVPSMDYYTGVIFRGFTYGVGFPILSGGRYDKLVENFGKKCPATGFSLYLNNIIAALNRSSQSQERVQIDFQVCYIPEYLKIAVDICSVLREEGFSVGMEVINRNFENVKEYADTIGIRAVINIMDADLAIIFNVESGEERIIKPNEIGRYLLKEEKI